MMEKHAEPLMFDVNCNKYGKMNEVLRFVRSSFVEKPPGLFFRHMYKDAGHPFYIQVYKEVAKVRTHKQTDDQS